MICKLCILVACLACGGKGLRLRARHGQSFSSQDAKVQKVMAQMDTRAGSSSLDKANHSGSRRANSKKIAPLLLALFNPAARVSSSSSRSAVTKHSVAPDASHRDAMMEQRWKQLDGPTVHVVVSVDWEGQDLLTENLDAMKAFRKAHPDVPLTHFLNAAYFTKNFYDQLFNEWSPYQALSPIDEHGLHLHGWRSLVENAGVTYRSEPDFVLTAEQVAESEKLEKELRTKLEKYKKEPRWLNKVIELVHPVTHAERLKLSKEIERYLSRDVGLDTDIRAYSVEEIRAIVRHSKAILEKQGLAVGQSFRAGAWLAGPNVLEAIRHEGFLVNSSAVGFDQMIGEPAGNSSSAGEASWRDKPLSGMLRELWPDITNESPPYIVETPAGHILEMPDTGGMADYATVEEMVDHINKAVQQDSEERFVHFGFHQETAAEYVPRVIAAIAEIKRKHGHRVVFETLEASAQRALALQRLRNEPSVMRHH